MPQPRKRARQVPGRKKRVTAATRDVARTKLIARKLAQVAPDEEPARVAGAIAIFAAETIKRSANNLIEARAYLEGLRGGIDGLLKNAFPDGAHAERDEAAE